MLTYRECFILFRGNYTNFADIDMYARAKKLKEKLDQKIEDLQQPQAPNHTAASSSGTASAGASAHAALIAVFEKRNRPRKMDQLYAKLNQRKIKAVALSLIYPFADQFIDQSLSIPVISKLFLTDNLSLGYSELLAKCIQLHLNILSNS